MANKMAKRLQKAISQAEEFVSEQKLGASYDGIVLNLCYMFPILSFRDAEKIVLAKEREYGIQFAR